ncbi:MAG: sodium:solute symporter family protein [Lachnospiraceae bacterium]|nr:sodium:solute symporter family protein [Lachnospiraceae bacterium]
MVYSIIIFIVLLFTISIFDFKRVKTFDDYALAGKAQGFWPVYLSMMVSMIGASATLGVADKVWDIGFSAFCWLGVGAIGLLLQGIFISKKIRELNATTLPDIAEKTVGEGAKSLLSLIIAISWIGIIGAQIVSLVKIVKSVATGINENVLIIIIAAVVILHTMLGGQLSVLKTDMLQSGVILVGILGTFIYLYMCKGENNQDIFNNLQMIDSDFGYFDFVYLLFITGGTYFLGPDIISRNIISKDGKTARNATILAAFSIGVIGFIVTMIGMWSLYNLPVMHGENPLIYIMDKIIPTPLAVFLCLALMATLISSADTCLINAATIIEHDLLKRNNVKELRFIILIMGIASLFIALVRSDIIDLLLGAYSIYSPGIVFPLLVAIVSYKKRKINKTLWLAAVILGGIMGLINSYFMIGPKYLPLLGMGLSLVLSLVSVLQSSREKC